MRNTEYLNSRTIAIFLGIFLMLSSCRTYLNRLDNRYQMRYFPTEYANIYLGMPLKEVKVVRPAMNPTGETDSLFTEYFEYIGRDKIASTSYYFNQDSMPPTLQRLIIEFETLEETTKTARWLYGKPNTDDGSWEFDSKEDFIIEVNKSGKKITIGKPKPQS